MRYSRETLNHGVNESHCYQKEDLATPEDFCRLFVRKSFLWSKIRCKNARVVIHDPRATCWDYSSVKFVRWQIELTLGCKKFLEFGGIQQGRPAGT